MYQSKPAKFLATKPFSICSATPDCGLNRPFTESCAYAMLNGSRMTTRSPSRGAASPSRIAPASVKLRNDAGGVPGVPTAFGMFWYAYVAPSRSILLATAATAGLMMRSLNMSTLVARSAVVNCTSTWNWVVSVTGM